MRVKTSLVAIVCFCFVAIGLGSIGWMIFHSTQLFKESQQIVRVKGLAEEVVKSDLSVWEINYKVSATNLPDLYKISTTQGQTLIEFLKSHGITPEEIESLPPAVTDLHQIEYRNSETLAPERFTATGSVIVRTARIESVQKAFAEIFHLLEKGVILQAGAPKFFFTRLMEMRPQMISRATLSAKEMAQQFAKDAGTSINGIKTAVRDNLKSLTLTAVKVGIMNPQKVL